MLCMPRGTSSKLEREQHPSTALTCELFLQAWNKCQQPWCLLLLLNKPFPSGDQSAMNPRYPFSSPLQRPHSMAHRHDTAHPLPTWSHRLTPPKYTPAGQNPSQPCTAGTPFGLHSPGPPGPVCRGRRSLGRGGGAQGAACSAAGAPRRPTAPRCRYGWRPTRTPTRPAARPPAAPRCPPRRRSAAAWPPGAAPGRCTWNGRVRSPGPCATPRPRASGQCGTSRAPRPTRLPPPPSSLRRPPSVTRATAWRAASPITAARRGRPRPLLPPRRHGDRSGAPFPPPQRGADPGAVRAPQQVPTLPSPAVSNSERFSPQSSWRGWGQTVPSVQNQHMATGKQEHPRGHQSSSTHGMLSRKGAEGLDLKFFWKKIFFRTRFFYARAAEQAGCSNYMFRRALIFHSAEFPVKCSPLETHTAFNSRKMAAGRLLGKKKNLPKTPVVSANMIFSHPQRQAALSRNKDKEESLTGFYFLIKISSVPYLYQRLIKWPVKITSLVSILKPMVSLEATITLPPVSEPGEPPSCLLGVLFQLRQFLCHRQLPAPGVPPLFLKQDQCKKTLCACRCLQGTLYY